MQTTLRHDHYSDRWGQLQDHIRELHSFLSSHADVAPTLSSSTPASMTAGAGTANERRQLLNAYLHRLRSNAAVLHLALPQAAPHPSPLQTHDVYVPLNVVVAGTDATPYNLFAALREHRHLMLLGPDGAGKTTTLNQIAGVMAAAISDDGQHYWMQRLEGWNRGPRLPIRVQLAQAIAQYTGEPLDALWTAVPELAQGHLTRHERTLLQLTLAQTLERGQGILLIDGLNELLEGPQRDAAQHILEAARTRYDASFILAAYRGDDAPSVAEQHPAWMSAVIAPMQEHQIEAFVARWYDALTQLGYYGTDTAKERANKLCMTLRANKQLAQLANRPQRLALITAVHADYGQLPPQLVKQVWQDVLAGPTTP